MGTTIAREIAQSVGPLPSFVPLEALPAGTTAGLGKGRWHRSSVIAGVAATCLLTSVAFLASRADQRPSMPHRTSEVPALEAVRPMATPQHSMSGRRDRPRPATHRQPRRKTSRPHRHRPPAAAGTPVPTATATPVPVIAPPKPPTAPPSGGLQAEFF